MKWWGWGPWAEEARLINRPGVLPYLDKKFVITQWNQRPKWESIELDAISIPESRLSNELLEILINKIGQDQVSVDPGVRVVHSKGRSFRDAVEIRSRVLSQVTDAVLFPRDIEMISKIVQWANDFGVAIVPFAGGTSVVGGVEPCRGNHQAVATMNLTFINKILAIDETNGLAHVECGIFGPDLEQFLQKRGWTLGHFPQSFEYSTLGGWIAARSSGQNSVKYGGIEKLVESLTLLSPSGMVSTRSVPREAAGGSWKDWIIGSEGRYGIITSAWVRISKMPEEKKYVFFAFPNMATAVEAVRKITLHSQVQPAMIRISDELETEGLMAMGKSQDSFINRIIKKFGTLWLNWKGINAYSMVGVMIGFEGSAAQNDSNYFEISDAFEMAGGVDLGVGPGDKWLKDRFRLPYARDEFMDQGILVDTLETATRWSQLLLLHSAVRDSLMAAAQSCAWKCLVYCHVSHVYKDGASLYFTVLAKPETAFEIDAVEILRVWKILKDAASSTIVSNGAAISHHHGIGCDHLGYGAASELESGAMKATSLFLDPNGIMNPEKVFN